MNQLNYFLHETAVIDDNVIVGRNTKIWHFSHIQSGAIIGSSCSLGQNVNISNNVHIGSNVKIQNNVSVYEGVTIEDYVFCGPSCVFTNDLTPRSRYPKKHKYLPTIVHHDATIGANATIVCGHEVGRHATIAAGAVVTTDVPPHALFAGVPAKQIGWVCECGQVLKEQDKNSFTCPDCGRRYYIKNGMLWLQEQSSRSVGRMQIQFRDLQRQYEHIKPSIDGAVAEVIASAHFISGEQVKELETTLAAYAGREHCISCANGTDAISIALMAHGVGDGDAVFVPDFTFFSSGECPAMVGATPIFVDVSNTTYNIDPASLEAAVEKVTVEGHLKPKAAIAVDLFGQPFEYEKIRSICDKYGLLLLEDAAQGFGGSVMVDGQKKMACNLGDISTTSFFPAKPLGCYGDGGAIFTDDDEIAMLCRSIAVHGKDMGNPDDPNARYNNVRLGVNSRLDTLQAGVLFAKFPTFCDEELDAANHVADMYSERLLSIEGLTLPKVLDGHYSSWAQYTVQLPEGTDRAGIQKRLKEQGIPTNIYYIKPMHRQGAFSNTRSAVADCPVTERLCERVLCLPIHPYLKDEEVIIVCEALKNIIQRTDL